jgi:hypothetical protein
VAARPTKTEVPATDERVKKACGIMADIRARLYRRLADYVLSNEGRIRAETSGEETYSFCLQQMEEMFLNRLNVVERAVAELGRSEYREGVTTTTTTYETVEVSARREDLPQRVADALAERAESDLLDVCILRADDRHAEIMLILSRQETHPAPDRTATDRAARDGGGASGDSGT